MLLRSTSPASSTTNLGAIPIDASGQFSAVVDAWIDLKRGKRSTSDHIDKVRATGTTGGLPEGAKLTLWLRSPGQDKFRRSGAKIIVRADGSFQWTRKVRDSRGLTAYVSYAKTDSNRIQWSRVK